MHPNQKARSSEINRNFDTIMQILGTVVGDDRLLVNREFMFGVRNNALLSSLHDTGAANYKYFQISWNADWNENPAALGTFLFSRVVAGENATAIRIGQDGFTVLGTSSTSGELNGQMKSMFKVTPTTGEDRIVIGESWHIQRYDGLARNIQDYRLTYTILTQPISIYEGQALSDGERVYDAYNLGIPSSAKAIMLSGFSWANPASGTMIMLCYKERSPRNKKWGFGMATNNGGWAMGQGVVPLGEGAYAGKFVVKSYQGSFNEANLFIVGYYV